MASKSRTKSWLQDNTPYIFIIMIMMLVLFDQIIFPLLHALHIIDNVIDIPDKLYSFLGATFGVFLLGKGKDKLIKLVKDKLS
jgi:hypothetical protein